MRKLLFILLVVSMAIPVLTISEPVLAGSKSAFKLVGDYSREIKALRTNKDFVNKRVLLVVGDQRKSTTLEGLLSAVELALSEPQHSIFVEPILMAQSQNMGYVNVNASGPVIKSVKLAKQPPADHAGLAALVISFEGDTTLPAQALANIRTQ